MTIAAKISQKLLFLGVNAQDRKTPAKVLLLELLDVSKLCITLDGFSQRIGLEGLPTPQVENVANN